MTRLPLGPLVMTLFLQVTVACGLGMSAAVTASGKLCTWGNASKRLGHGSISEAVVRPRVVKVIDTSYYTIRAKS